MLEFRVWSLGFRICALGLMVNGLRLGFNKLVVAIFCTVLILYWYNLPGALTKALEL